MNPRTHKTLVQDADTESTTVRTGNTVRRSTRTESGPRSIAHAPIDYQTPNQTFPSLYCTVALIIQECGACAYSDLAMVPALSRYSAFQLERALLTAEHHGLIRKVATLPPHHPDAADPEDPDGQSPGIFDVDPLGSIDRNNPQDTIRRALATRPALEISWLRMAPAHAPSQTQ